MQKKIKWSLIIVIALIVVSLSLMFFVHRLLDFQQIKGVIARQVSEASGRPFEMNGDLRLSLFPWAAVKTEDIRLGNAPGFGEKYMVKVKSFEARIKLVPLVTSFFKDFQVKKFILNGAEVVLETNRNGRGNWEWTPKDIKKTNNEKAEPRGQKNGSVIPLNNLIVNEFAISNSSVLWIDHSKGDRFQVSDINLHLNDFSIERPVYLVFSGRAGDHPLSLDGHVGPLGKDFGQKTIPLDLKVNILNRVEIKLKGHIRNTFKIPGFELWFDIPRFSLRKLIVAAGRELPMTTADPAALDRIDIKAMIKGNIEKFSVHEGSLGMDDSRLNFSCEIANLSRPDVKFDLALDQVDLNRYMPPKTEKGPEENKEETKRSQPTGKKRNYEKLRSLSLDGGLRIGKLKFNNTFIEDINLRLHGKNGVFHMDPLNLRTYGGDMQAEGTFKVQHEIAESNFKLKLKGINSGPLIKDVIEKDLLDGLLNTELSLQAVGDDAGSIKKSLNGNGAVYIENGALKGIDLNAMIRNTDGAYGFSAQSNKQRKTPFSLFSIPFSIKDGVFFTQKTKLTAPLFRVEAKGRADFINETLDFRIEPTVVTTKDTDQERMKASEIMVPVLLTGSFSSPKYTPDLKGAAKMKLKEKILESEKFKKVFEKEELKPIEKDVKELLEGLF